MSEEEPEIPRAEHYPPYVQTEDERRRWDASLAIARQLFADDGEEAVWFSARSIYKGDIPTDE